MSILSAIKISKTPALAFLAVGLFWGCFAAQVPVVKAGLGASDAAFGSMLLGSGIGLVSAMFLAPRIDHWLGARGMQVSAVLLGVFVLLPAFAGSLWAFFFVMALLGLASGLLDVLMNTRVSEIEHSSGRSLMNANHGVFSVGYALGAIGAGVLREAGLPPSVIFSLFGGVLVVLAWGLRMAPDTDHDADEGTVVASPFWPVALCGAVTLVAFMSEATVEAWSALHIERTLHGGAAEGAMGPATLGLTMAFGRFSGQAVAERLREWQVVIVASVISSAGALIAATAATPMMAYVGFGVLGLGVSVIGPMALALVGKLVRPSQRSKAISRVAVIAFSGFFFAPVLMGYSSELWGLRVSFGLVAVFLLLAVPLAMSLKVLQGRRNAAPA